MSLRSSTVAIDCDASVQLRIPISDAEVDEALSRILPKQFAGGGTARAGKNLLQRARTAIDELGGATEDANLHVDLVRYFVDSAKYNHAPTGD